MKSFKRIIVSVVAIGAITALSEAKAAPVSSELFIVSPAPGEVIASDEVTVQVRLPDGFELIDPQMHAEHTEGQGHLHLWLDALPNHADETSVVRTESGTYTYKNVFSGLHAIYVELYRNDHLQYDPPISAQVQFETFKELLTAPSDEVPASAPPTSKGGLFLPPGGGNTLLAILIIAIAIGILWYIFGKSRRKQK